MGKEYLVWPSGGTTSLPWFAAVSKPLLRLSFPSQLHRCICSLSHSFSFLPTPSYMLVILPKVQHVTKARVVSRPALISFSACVTLIPTAQQMAHVYSKAAEKTIFPLDIKLETTFLLNVPLDNFAQTNKMHVKLSWPSLVLVSSIAMASSTFSWYIRPY